MSIQDNVTEPEQGLDSYLADALRQDSRLSVDDTDALLGAVRASVEEERGWRDWLRSRPTRLRISAALMVVLGVSLGGAVLAGPSMSGQFVAKMLSLTIVATVLVLVGMRPVHRGSLPRFVRVGVLLLAVAVPAAFPMFGELLAGGTGPGLGFLATLLGAVPCFLKGSMVAVPLVLAVALLHRGDRAYTTVFLAAAAGVGGNMLLESRCAGGPTVHMLAGHVGIIAVFSLCAYAAIALRKALTSRS